MPVKTIILKISINYSIIQLIYFLQCEIKDWFILTVCQFLKGFRQVSLHLYILVNYGAFLLQALLEHWPQTFQPEEVEEGQQTTVLRKVGNAHFSVPGHTPVIFR